MERPQTIAANQEIAESLTALEFDPEKESFQAMYDSASDSTVLAVVAVVATILGEEPESLTPLQTVIDTDALDKLARDSTTALGTCDSISFKYEGFEITVTSEDVTVTNPTFEANSIVQ